MAEDDEENYKIKKKTLSDKELWHFAVQDVDPLKRREHPPKIVEAAGEAAEQYQAVKKIKRPLWQHIKVKPPNEQKSTELDKRTRQRFEKGLMRIDGRLDLHGYRREQAHHLLNQFILSASSQDKRCLLVITGKGKGGVTSDELDFLGRPARAGILKDEVPRWLAMEPLASLILRIAPAQPKDGGSGALYVLLRRNKRC